MFVLVACEESQAVCIEFRLKGHQAFSCDIQKCSGGHPEWHYNGSLWDIINGGMFVTESGELISVEKWDLMIGHPTCTYLTLSGNKWFGYEYFPSNLNRWCNRFEAAEFFIKMLSCGIKKICLENPIGYINGFIKPTQIIQPYYFGDEAQKTTCLWLKGLPKLIHVKSEGGLFGWDKTHVNKGEMMVTSGGNVIPKWIGSLTPSPERAKIRSKTFHGIAKAMAEQWG